MRPKSLNYYDSAELEASAIIKAGPGTLFSVTGVNNKGSAQYVQIHDSATLPADTAVPKIVLRVAGEENFFYEFREIGRFFKNGITVCNSSILATKTLGSADCFFNAQYV